MSSEENDNQMEVDNQGANGSQVEEKKVEETPAAGAVAKPVQSAGSGAAPLSHYRVKISGLPRFYTPLDPLLLAFKKMLVQELHLDFKYIRSPKKGNSWLYITFFQREQQEKALKLLKHYVWKGRTLICTLVVADVLKRKLEDGSPDAYKKVRLDIPLEEQMLMATIPYHSVSYQEQLSKKNEEAECLFRWLVECMEKKNPKLVGYMDQEVAKHPKTNTPFKLEEVRSATVIDGCRNKCEFRIARDVDTKKIVIGYRVDNQEDENIAVAPPDSLRHMPKEMINLCKAFEKFVEESPYEPQVQNHDPGVWRLFHIRTNKAKELLVVVLINHSSLDEKQLAELKIQLIHFFSNGPGSQTQGHNVVSLYIHMDPDLKMVGSAGDKLKKPTGILEHLWGLTHIEEQILDLKLDIDPNFYFQNNTYGAEVLYKAVMEVADADKDTIILDLCCGSGGMGMMFAKHCKKVIGVEVMEVNVTDAKRQAAKNGLTNCEFIEGALDDLLPELEEKLKGEKVIPILDPPRAGISAQTILGLRKMSEAQRIIYVCSNHKLPSKNIMDFASTKGDTSSLVGKEPFFPKRVIPVDISPHSLRCELVISLDRLNVTTLPKSTRPPVSKFGVVPYNQRNFDYKVNKFSRYPRGGVRGVSRGFMRGMSELRDSFVRDSYYPLPMRGGPGRGFRKPMYAPHPPPPPPRPYPRGYDYAPPPPPHARGPPSPYEPYPIRDYGEDRYTELRRDVEDAMDSYPPPRGVNRRLAMANVMLEQGLRMATEAMADDYPRSSVSESYIRRTRGSMGAVPPSRGGMRMDRSMGMERGGGMGMEREMERGMRMGMERDFGMDRGEEWGMNRNSWGRDEDNGWQSNWNSDHYEMAPPKPAIPMRPMRGMRGGPIRGRGGSRSRAGKLQGGGVWRH